MHGELNKFGLSNSSSRYTIIFSRNEICKWWSWNADARMWMLERNGRGCDDRDLEYSPLSQLIREDRTAIGTSVSDESGRELQSCLICSSVRKWVVTKQKMRLSEIILTGWRICIFYIFNNILCSTFNPFCWIVNFFKSSQNDQNNIGRRVFLMGVAPTRRAEDRLLASCTEAQVPNFNGGNEGYAVYFLTHINPWLDYNVLFIYSCLSRPRSTIFTKIFKLANISVQMYNKVYI